MLPFCFFCKHAVVVVLESRLWTLVAKSPFMSANHPSSEGSERKPLHRGGHGFDMGDRPGLRSGDRLHRVPAQRSGEEF